MTNICRREVIRRIGTAAFGMLSATSHSQPTAPIEARHRPPLGRSTLRIVIPANEGGGWDQTGRALGTALLEANVAERIDYENIGGKGGTIGLARFVEKYDADPNALLISGMVMVGAVALQKPAIDMSRVSALARLSSDYEVIVVRRDSPIKTAKDLVIAMRTDPATARIAGGSAGGIDHMFAGLLARASGDTAALRYEPFPGGAEVAAAVASGSVMAGISGYSEFSLLIASGDLRAIGTSAKSSFLGLPSTRQQGVDADLSNWRGVFTGKSIPAQRQHELLKAVKLATTTPSWSAAIKNNRWDPFWMEGDDFKSFLELDSAIVGVMVYLLKLRG